MKKQHLIGISISILILLIQGSLTNVLGSHIVQSSNQNVINYEKIDQRELLFQTIVNIAHNKEIQQIIIKYQTNGYKFFKPNMKYSVFNSPVLTINKLKQMYNLGIMLSKLFFTSKIQLMIRKHQFGNEDMYKEISTIIENDIILNLEKIQLQNSKCDCENENTIEWDFPIFCFLLLPLVSIAILLYKIFNINLFFHVITSIGFALHCFWIPY